MSVTIMTECKHPTGRMLWLDMSDAKDAYLQDYPDDHDLSGLKQYYDMKNIFVCTECGAEIHPRLFKVRYNQSTDFDGGQWDEVLRVLAYSFETTIDFVKEQMFTPEYREQVEEDGDDEIVFLFLSEQPDECDCEDDMHDCYIQHNVTIEEMKEYTEDDLTLGLLTPTLGRMEAFHDLTTPA